MELTIEEIFSNPVRADSALLFRNAYELTKHLLERTPTPDSHIMLVPPTWRHTGAIYREVADQVASLVRHYQPRIALCQAINSSTLVSPEWVAIFRKGRGNTLLEGTAVAERMRSFIATQGGTEWLHWRMYLRRGDLHFRELRRYYPHPETMGATGNFLPGK